MVLVDSIIPLTNVRLLDNGVINNVCFKKANSIVRPFFEWDYEKWWD